MGARAYDENVNLVETLMSSIKHQRQNQQKILNQKEEYLNKIDNDIECATKMLQVDEGYDFSKFQSIKAEGDTSTVSKDQMEKLVECFKETRVAYSNYFDSLLKKWVDAEEKCGKEMHDMGFGVHYDTAKNMIDIFKM